MTERDHFGLLASLARTHDRLCRARPTRAPPGFHPMWVMTGRARPETFARGLRTGRGMVTLMPEAPAASEDEGAEVERLRAEVASLRSRLRQHNESGREPIAQAERAARQRWRTILASLLIVIACVLAPLSVVAVWTKNQVTNTDRYVRTMAPLASEPAIQRALTDRITAKVFASVDVKALYSQAVDALAKQGLPPNRAAQLQSFAVPVANGVQSFTHSQVAKITSSAAFANAWVQVNRQAHAALVKALTGKGGGAVTINNDTVTLNLGPLIHTVKQQLVASGFSLAAKIPETNASFVLFQSPNLTKAQSGFNLLNKLGIWLPIIVLVLIALGVYVAKSHRRTLVGACLGVGAGMIVLALVIAVGAFLTGPSVTAVRAREGLARGIGWLRGGAESAGLCTGPVGTWVYEHKQALRIGAVAVAGLALVFWGQ